MARTEPPTSVDLDKAMLDPGAVFDSPDAVVAHGALSRDQKVEILRRWHYDASEVSVAAEEGMTGHANAELIRRIMVALDRLSGGIDPEQTSSTKQHGLLRSAVRPK